MKAINWEATQLKMGKNPEIYGPLGEDVLPDREFRLVVNEGIIKAYREYIRGNLPVYVVIGEDDSSEAEVTPSDKLWHGFVIRGYSGYAVALADVVVKVLNNIVGTGYVYYHRDRRAVCGGDEFFKSLLTITSAEITWKHLIIENIVDFFSDIDVDFELIFNAQMLLCERKK